MEEIKIKPERILYHIARIVHKKKIELCSRCKTWKDSMSSGLFWFNIGKYTKALKIVDYLPNVKGVNVAAIKMNVSCPHCGERFVENVPYGKSIKSCWFCKKQYSVEMVAIVKKYGRVNKDVKKF